MDIYDKFSAVSILVIGDIMLDRYWWGDVKRISPEAPVPVVELKRSTFAAGGSANVAANIAGLGAKVTLVGATGDDGEADTLVELLTKNGIETKIIIRDPSRQTSVKTRVIAHNQQVIRLDNETTVAISPEIEETILANAAKALPAADLVIVSDYAKGLLTETLLAGVIAHAKAAEKPVIVDPKGKDYGKYAGASLITPNKREAAYACNLEMSTRDIVVTCGGELIKCFGFETVLITEGEDGMTLFQKGSDAFHIPAAAKSVYDVTGAGDTVIATLAVALAAGLSHKEAAHLANIAAGLVVEQVGTTAITRHMLESQIARNDL